MLRNASRTLTNVLIPNDALAGVRAHIERDSRRIEHGGILLGYRKPDAIHITSMTYPGRWDRPSSMLFRRSARGHRIRALREWVKSRQTVDWVGEWHTHPDGLAKPSIIDRMNWLRISRHTSKPMTFLIFSDHDLYVCIQTHRQRNPIQLNFAEAADGWSLFSAN
jgi:integrative and conjugative element protein (TIGR02256 family)